MTNKSGQWTLTLPCTRAEAELLGEDFDLFDGLDPMPSILTEEVEAFNDNEWRLIAYFPQKPDKRAVAHLQSLLPSATGAKPLLEQLPEANWTVISQAHLQPVHTGRFYVHTSANKGEIPAGCKSFLIEASQAFGTGGHETTAGCLEMLDLLKQRGKRFSHIADIGTGTGLLAFAASHLWPRAYVTASDIDPVSIDVTAHNAAVNNIFLGLSPGRVGLCVASGTDHEMIIRRAPYDLVIANILAGPLTELAPALSEIVADGGTLILAGLLDTQIGGILNAYRRQGFYLAKRKDKGDWPCLHLIKRKRHGWRRPLRAGRATSQPEGDFGTW